MPSWPRRQFERPALTGAISTEQWFRATGIAPIATSQAWAVANQAVYMPVISPTPWVALGAFLYNGATVSGAFDIGIYLPDSEGKPGRRLWHTGLTPQAGTNQIQTASVASPYGAIAHVPEGLAYLAVSFDNTTSTVIAIASLTTDGKNILGSIFTEASACPLPATATPVLTPTACKVPIVIVGGV